MEPQFVSATLIDDDSERPTIPSLRPRKRPKIRKKTPGFDAHAERFFSNAETVPELLPDARYLAELDGGSDHDAEAWWVAQRRRRNLRLVMMLCAACVALFCLGALR